MGFDFEKEKQAKAFAAAIKQRFNLDAEVDRRDYRTIGTPPYPFGVEVQRPDAKLDPTTEAEWEVCCEQEHQIEALAKEFGGDFIGT